MHDQVPSPESNMDSRSVRYWDVQNLLSFNLTLALALLAILVAGWMGGQLLRQNGRLLLRLEDLEKRLDELEFGEPDAPAGLALGSFDFMRCYRERSV